MFYLVHYIIFYDFLYASNILQQEFLKNSITPIINLYHILTVYFLVRTKKTVKFEQEAHLKVNHGFFNNILK